MMSDSTRTRELMHSFICDALARANEDKGMVDTSYEASLILDEIEKRCIGRVRGELIFSDPADEAGFLEGGPSA